MSELNHELLDLAIKGDSTIYAHVRTWQASDGMISYTEMLEKLTIALAKEKKHYLDTALELTNRRMPGPILYEKYHKPNEELNERGV